MPLFDNRERNHLGPARFSEDPFRYYDRSARPGVAAIRETLNAWFDRYPEGQRQRLRRVFETDFDTAFFELFVFALLEAQGYSTVVEPRLRMGAPDFGIELDGEIQVVIEATVSRGETAVEAAARRIREQLLDQINELKSMGFLLQVNIARIGEQQPSGSRLRREVDAWLAELDPDDIVQTYKNHSLSDLPEWRFEDRGTTVRFRPIPVRPESRNEVIDRPIASHGAGGARRRAEDEPILRSLKNKGRKYRNVEVPYIIAVNAKGDFPCEPRDIANAVFGHEVLVEILHGDNTITWARERRGGLWTPGAAPSKTHVSSVVVFIDCDPWRIGNTPAFVVANPHADHPDDRLFAAFPRMRLGEGGVTVEISEGSTTGELLGVPAGWPGSLERVV